MLNLILIALVIFSAFLGAIGATLLKKSTEKLIRVTLKGLFTNKYLILGGLFFVTSSIIYIFTLRKGDLSVMYPIVSTTYIWTTVFSVKYIGEKMNLWKYAGLVAILLGVILIGLGS